MEFKRRTLLSGVAASVVYLSGCSTGDGTTPATDTTRTEDRTATTGGTTSARNTTTSSTAAASEDGILYAIVIESAPDDVEPPVYPDDAPENQYVTRAVEEAITEAADDDDQQEVTVTFPMDDMEDVERTYDALPGSSTNDQPGHYLQHEGEIVRLRLAIQQ